jgi:hypothetical protein
MDGTASIQQLQQQQQPDFQIVAFSFSSNLKETPGFLYKSNNNNNNARA